MSEALRSAIKRRIRSIMFIGLSPRVLLFSNGTKAGACRSVAQQVVQAGLGARLRIDRLDDDGRVGAVVLARLGLLGQVAADDDAAGRHAAEEGFSGVAVEDRGA